jgi:hypothetical protein
MNRNWMVKIIQSFPSSVYSITSVGNTHVCTVQYTRGEFCFVEVLFDGNS